jgi:hypothetical protein
MTKIAYDWIISLHDSVYTLVTICPNHGCYVLVQCELLRMILKHTMEMKRVGHHLA